MKNMGLVAVAAIALLLSGCAGQTAVAVSETTAAAPVAAPITQAPTTAEAGTEAPIASDADFIAAAAYSWRGELPPEADLLAARDYTCETLESGTPIDEVRAVAGTGEDADWNNDHIVKAAVTLACPSFDN